MPCIRPSVSSTFRRVIALKRLCLFPFFLGRTEREFCPSTLNDSLCKKCDTDNFIDNLRYFLQVSAISTEEAVPSSKPTRARLEAILQNCLSLTKKDNPYTDGSKCSKGGLYAYSHAIKFKDIDNDTKIEAVYFKAFHAGKQYMNENLNHFQTVYF